MVWEVISSHFIALPGYDHDTLQYTCLLLLILMHWQQGSDSQSKGDQLCSAAECRIRIQGLWNRISGRLNARWQTDWAIEDHAKNLNSIALPYDQRALNPLDPTADITSPLALAIYMFVSVNFDALVTGKWLNRNRFTSNDPGKFRGPFNHLKERSGLNFNLQHYRKLHLAGSSFILNKNLN